jgi:NDP-sugar pyrophosphorylase family protein
MINIVIPLAGEGTRFSSAGYKTPKPLMIVNGKTMIEHAVETLGIDGRYIFITKEYKNDLYNSELSSIIKRLKPDAIEIKLDKKQRGAADAVMYAEEYIDNKNPLISINCDQILNWNADEFLDFVQDSNCDGAVVLFKATDPKHSYAEIFDNKIIKIVEKEVISNDALIGVHYWKHGSDFVSSAKELLNIDGPNEVYISQTYSVLLKNNKDIRPFNIPNNDYINLGTPEDVSIYLGKVKEFYTEKPKTIFCDIDGTIIKHLHKFSDLGKFDAEILPGVINKFNEWDSKGYKIILTTARKESARAITEKHLNGLGLCWDILIMGVTSGHRILINDKLNYKDEDRATAINLITNDGFDSTYWEEYGL